MINPTQAVQDTAFRLSRHIGTDAASARLLGLSRSAYTQFKNGCKLPSLRTAYRLSRLASSRGIDRLADAMSADGKRTLPLPIRFLTNGSILDEVSDNTEAIGHAIKAFRQGALDEAEGQAKSAIAALYRLLAEIDARRGLPPTVGGHPAGDTLPDPTRLSIA